METNLSVTNVAQTRVAAAARAVSATRIAYVDLVRVALTILVIVVHAACTYGALGGGLWTYSDPMAIDEVTEILMSLFVILCQSFFMSLFFFFAGYFTPGSYDKKNPAQFWKDRLLRLGIPLVAYTLFLSRIPNYIQYAANEGGTASFWQYSINTYWSEADAGPTWFLFALLSFVAVYTLWRLGANLIKKDRLAWVSKLPAPGILSMLGFALVMGAGMFAVAQVNPIVQGYELFETITLFPAFFPFYVLMFTAGILAYRSGWLERISGASLRFWAWLSLALVIFLPVFMFLGAPDGNVEILFSGFTWRCAVTSLWMGLACMSFSTTLTLWVRERKSSSNRLASYAGPNTFGVYLIHPLVLIPITLGLSFIAIHPLIKFALASITTVPICYILADGLRRVPGVKTVL
ncbi:MAG: acyltransferase [Chloroflexi bacterium]|nr:acyltransferase [Chloroflexota bacterium]